MRRWVQEKHKLEVWKLFNRKVDENENRDSLILELSDSLLFIVLWKWFPSRLNLVWVVTLYPLNFHTRSLFLAKQNVLLLVKSVQLPHRCSYVEQLTFQIQQQNMKKAKKKKKVSPPVLLSAAVITRNSAAGCTQLHLTGGSEQRRLRLVHFKALIRCRSSSEVQFPPLRQLNCTYRSQRQRWNTQQVLFPPPLLGGHAAAPTASPLASELGALILGALQPGEAQRIVLQPNGC